MKILNNNSNDNNENEIKNKNKRIHKVTNKESY